MNQTITKLLFLTWALLAGLGTSNAQVTIGSGTKPAQGALLDLRNKADGMSDKGLGMPRVKLTEIDQLYPMFKPADPEYQGAKKDTQDARHTGLWVYHLSDDPNPQCATIPHGLYVWDGKAWQGVGIKAGDATTLAVSKPTIDLPSGHDERALANETVNITWKPASETLSRTDDPATGGASFTSDLSATTGGSSTFTITPQAMATPDADSPWQSKTTTVSFKVMNECTGAPITETVIINQTNFALKANDLFVDSKLSLITAITTQSIPVVANTTWKATVIDPGGILGPPQTLTGGQVLTDGKNTASLDENFTFTSAEGVGTRLSRATITFEDTNIPKAAKDITISTASCLGTEDYSGLTKATPAQTSGADIWGEDIILHEAKVVEGVRVYEQFTSARFGEAGRWMTINLSAWQYDTELEQEEYHDGGLRFERFNGILEGSFSENETRPFWFYPTSAKTIGDNAEETPEYKAEPALGLIYSWAAATAGKGGIDGLGNVDDHYFVIDPDDPDYENARQTDESGFPEWAGEGVPPPLTQKRRQGICPAGWHLPSDYEWTELEREIIRNTKKYAATAENIDNGDGSELAKVPQPVAGGPTLIGYYGYRGREDDGHGMAMLSLCAPIKSPHTHEPGYSLAPAANGFNVLFTGSYSPVSQSSSYHTIGTNEDMGYATVFFTSSAGRANGPFWASVIYRIFDHYYTSNYGLVERIHLQRHTNPLLASVRCKKD